MATSVRIPVQVYLDTSYRPDREYIDGELRERNVGRWEHARLQLLIGTWFANHERQWQVMASTEQRVQVSSERVRIPDLVVLRTTIPPEVLVDPPLLVIEILSPAETYWDTQERAADYLAMGVETIWIVDPKTRSGRVCVGDTWHAATRLEVPGTGICLDLSELFPFLIKPSA